MIFHPKKQNKRILIIYPTIKKFRNYHSHIVDNNVLFALIKKLMPYLWTVVMAEFVIPVQYKFGKIQMNVISAVSRLNLFTSSRKRVWESLSTTK